MAVILGWLPLTFAIRCPVHVLVDAYPGWTPGDFSTMPPYLHHPLIRSLPTTSPLSLAEIHEHQTPFCRQAEPILLHVEDRDSRSSQKTMKCHLYGLVTSFKTPVAYYLRSAKEKALIVHRPRHARLQPVACHDIRDDSLRRSTQHQHETAMTSHYCMTPAILDLLQLHHPRPSGAHPHRPVTTSPLSKTLAVFFPLHRSLPALLFSVIPQPSGSYCIACLSSLFCSFLTIYGANIPHMDGVHRGHER